MTSDFKPSFDWKSTIISQYGNSPVLKKLIENIANLLDPTPDIKVFYDNILNPETAKGVGIKIWSRIVAMANAEGVDVEQGTFFGYQDSLLESFDNAPFVYDTPGAGRFQFTDASLRTLVFSKALANISTATLPILKEYLRTILGSDQFAVDSDENTVGGGGTMAVQFVISGTKPVTLQLFRLYIPKVIGAGVKVKYKASGANFFGFKGMDIATPFGIGTFYDEKTADWSMGEV